MPDEKWQSVKIEIDLRLSPKAREYLTSEDVLELFNNYLAEQQAEGTVDRVLVEGSL